MRALRYANLEAEIERIAAKRLLEIGTCKGERAELMICAALRKSRREHVEYFGFDLFETPPSHEFAGRTPPAEMHEVAERLGSLCVKISLTKGDSRETLPASGLENIDFVFIDGGHSEETVKTDFENALKVVRPGAVFLLDDYWNYPGGGGCNALVDSLDRARFEVALLDPVDEFAKPYGKLRTQMVRVVPL